MPGPFSLEPDTLFAGEYKVGKKLGEGGMGAVYEVQQVATGRKRALKLMLPELVAKPDVRRRFETEARIGGRIDSDHVVDVIDVGVDDLSGAPWLVMELLEGEALDQYAERRGPLSTAEVREIFDQLCHALAEAHRQSIVHRDLKPENIFIARPRRKGPPFTVKILDFGIAKLTADAKTTTSKTKDILGSALWMAPEQADEGGVVGPATDVWALGLIAFRLLTGRNFWKAATAAGNQLVIFIKEAFVSPTPKASVRAAEYEAGDLLPPGFDAWFARCVCHDPSARFADAATAYEELDPLLGGPAGGVAASPAARSTTPRARRGVSTQFDAVRRAAPARRSLLPLARLRPKTVGAAVLLGALAGTLGATALRRLEGSTAPRGGSPLATSTAVAAVADTALADAAVADAAVADAASEDAAVADAALAAVEVTPSATVAPAPTTAATVTAAPAKAAPVTVAPAKAAPVTAAPATAAPGKAAAPEPAVSAPPKPAEDDPYE